MVKQAEVSTSRQPSMKSSIEMRQQQALETDEADRVSGYKDRLNATRGGIDKLAHNANLEPNPEPMADPSKRK